LLSSFDSRKSASLFSCDEIVIPKQKQKTKKIGLVECCQTKPISFLKCGKLHAAKVYSESSKNTLIFLPLLKKFEEFDVYLNNFTKGIES